MFEVDSKLLVSAIKDVIRLVNPKDEIIYIDVNKGKLTVKAREGLIKASKTISVDGKATLDFGTSHRLITALINNRQKVIMTKEEGCIKVKAKKGLFKGTFNIIDYDDFKILADNIDHIKIKEDICKNILNNISKVEIQPIFDTSAIPIFITIKSSKLELIAADRFHAAYYSDSIKANDLKIIIPNSYVSTLNSLIKENKDLELGFDTNCMYIKGNINAVFPLVGITDTKEIQIKEAFSNFKPDISVSVNYTDFKDALQNMKAIYEKGCFLELKTDESNLIFSCKTSKGKLNISIPVKYKIRNKSKPIFLELLILEDLFNRISGNFNISFQGDHICQIKTKETKYLSLALEKN